MILLPNHSVSFSYCLFEDIFFLFYAKVALKEDGTFFKKMDSEKEEEKRKKRNFISRNLSNDQNLKRSYSATTSIRTTHSFLASLKTSSKQNKTNHSQDGTDILYRLNSTLHMTCLTFTSMEI